MVENIANLKEFQEHQGLFGTTRVLERKERSSRNERKKQRNWDSGRAKMESE